MTPDPNTPDPGAPQAERAEHTQAGRDETDTAATQATDEVEAAERSRIATDGDPTLTDERTQKGHTTVTWERPTDLAAKGSAAALGRSTELPGQLGAAVQEIAAEHRTKLQQRLADRGEQIDPATIDRTSTPAPGREGVSR